MSLDFVQLFFVLGAAWVAGLLAVRFGLPAILGELAAGMLLGPAILGWLAPSDALKVLAEVGVYLLMLYIGMEIQPRQLLRASGAGLLAAIGGFVVPFALGIGLMKISGYSTTAALFMGMAMGVTSLATKSRILVDLDLVGTRIASVMMVGALFADTLALILFAAILGFAATGSFDALSITATAFKAILFFGAAMLIGLRVFPWLGKRLDRFGIDKRTANFTLVILVTLCFGELAHLAGLHGILGAFIAGLFLQEGIVRRKWSHELTEVVHDLSIGFLAPIFFVTAGFHVSLEVILTHTGLFASVVILATVGKIIGTALFYLPSKRGWREGVAVGAGMNGRGAVEVIVAEIGLAMGLITQEVFSILVLMAFLTTLTVPLLLGWMVRLLRKRGELALDDDGRDRIVILGATPFGIALAQTLSDQGRTSLIDRNSVRCKQAEALGLNVVQGDVLSHDVLSAAGAETARLLVSTLADVPTGIVAARYARMEFGIPVCAVPGRSGAQEAADADMERYGIQELAVNDEQLTRMILELTTDALALREVIVPDADADIGELLHSFGPDAVPIAVYKESAWDLVFSENPPVPGERLLLMITTQAKPKRGRAWQWLQTAPILEIEAPDVESCIRQLAKTLAETIDSDADVLADALMKREVEASTTITPGVAVPHALVPGIGEPRLVLGRSRLGISSRSEQPATHLWISVASDPAHRDWYLWTLWAIARLAGDSTFISQWADTEFSELPQLLNQTIQNAAAGTTEN